MPVSVIFGGQFGSEGKGKASHFFANEMHAKAVVRVGGPNSGHTVFDSNGNKFVLKQLPTPSIEKGIYSVITAGNYINLKILLDEVGLTGIDNEKLVIDPYAVIINQEDLQTEATGKLQNAIGSTGSGTGAALSRRINRDDKLQFAKDIPLLRQYIRETIPLLRSLLNSNERIIIEGTQGFGLSLLHSGYYPYATSRDTSASAFVSESGLSPLDVDDVIMVIRSFPIRVAGHSGPLPNEIDWKEVSRISGHSNEIVEYTSVTQRVRRVAKFDADVVLMSIDANNPSRIVLNHVDYFDASCRTGKITSNALQEIEKIEKLIKRPIDYIGMDDKTLYKMQKLATM